jgi:epoxyqueuosine reductase QueG
LAALLFCRTIKGMPSSKTVDVQSLIANRISDWVARADTATQYRPPLVAFARADDPRFAQLQVLVPGHLHPRDLLSDAQTVCVFFLPFCHQLVAANARSNWAAESWAVAYVETNALLADLCALLAAAVAEWGIRAAWQPPTHNFDPVRLVSAWSHKSAGAIAGLGQLGHHHMLITPAGCAGRLGSIVLGMGTELPPRGGVDGSFCAYDRGCRVCIRRCPVGALTEAGLDRERCYAQCLENDARLTGWLADVCGKCVTGPCGLHPADPGRTWIGTDGH